MPFDSTPPRPFDSTPQFDMTVLDKLKILRELLPQSGDQLEWRSCLWSAARRDERLQMAGIGDYDLGSGKPPTTTIFKFFGWVPEVDFLFGAHSRDAKKYVLDKMIEHREKLRREKDDYWSGTRCLVGE